MFNKPPGLVQKAEELILQEKGNGRKGKTVRKKWNKKHKIAAQNNYTPFD